MGGLVAQPPVLQAEMTSSVSLTRLPPNLSILSAAVPLILSLPTRSS